MQVAVRLDMLCPQAAYRGSLTANTKAAYDKIIWEDARYSKPTWAQILAVEEILPLDQRLFSVFDALPISAQATFSLTRFAVKNELQEGRVDVAKELIIMTTVPEELETLKQSLLDEFDKG